MYIFNNNNKVIVPLHSILNKIKPQKINNLEENTIIITSIFFIFIIYLFIFTIRILINNIKKVNLWR
jgi:hypothetical protein